MLTSLPQPYALRLEMIRAAGYSDREVISWIENKDAPGLKEKVNPDVDWEEFLAYAHQSGEAMRKAITEGYRFKFITAGGLQSLLRIRFGLQTGEDYRFDGSRFIDIRLCARNYELLRDGVPEQHWAFFISHRDHTTGEVRFDIALASAAN
ncbi:MULTISPECIES: hypothetical protein [Paenibacillus]|uniref:hypothetical protein n=1 Tax=Paenibacillus TaxID=44249 RepID=UPI002FE09247